LVDSFRYLILALLLALSILLASVAQAEVCIEQPPGVIHCGNDSPISPLVIRYVYLPMVWR